MIDAPMDRRLEWFDLGVKAFVAARPRAPRLYVCPLCLRGFDTPDRSVLSLEDVPPKSVGGKSLLLTCRQCNNTHGTELDAHIKAGRDIREIFEGTRETRGYFRVGEHRMAVKGTVFASDNKLQEMIGKSSPSDRDAVQSHFESLAGTDATGKEFHFGFSMKYDAWREQVAWLRVAYLYLSALLGYTFVLRAVLDPIRDQFAHPGEKLVPQIIKTMTDPVPDDCIVSVSLPAELRSFVVKVQRWIFFFPGFVDSDSFYDRLAKLPPRGALQVTGQRLRFPQGPVFACDFDPGFARFLAVRQAGGHDAGA